MHDRTVNTEGQLSTPSVNRCNSCQLTDFGGKANLSTNRGCWTWPEKDPSLSVVQLDVEPLTNWLYQHISECSNNKPLLPPQQRSEKERHSRLEQQTRKLLSGEPTVKDAPTTQHILNIIQMLCRIRPPISTHQTSACP